MNRTVVVPLVGPIIDPEGVSEQALPVARALARRTGAIVMLISVVDVLAELGGLPESELTSSGRYERHIEERKRYLDELANTFPETRTHTSVRTGYPADELLAALGDVADPILVMANHRKDGIRRFILGSTCFNCVQRAQCPVIIVPARPSGDRSGTASLDRILVPLDGSPLAESVLESVGDILTPPSLNMHLLEVIEPPSGRFRQVAPRYYDDISFRLADEYLQETAERLIHDGHTVTWETRSGEAEHVIAETAMERGVDLVAMATHGRTSIGRLIFGSVAGELVQATYTPILLVRPSREQVDSYVRSIRAGRRTDRAADLHPGPAPLRVGDVMVSPAITLSERATLDEVTRTMLENRIGCVPLVDDDGVLTGIITESDFTGKERSVPFSAYRTPTLFGQWISREGIERIYETGRTLSAAQIMTRPVVTATEDELLTRVVERFIEHDITRIPVVRDGTPVGVVARRDLLKILLEGPEIDPDEGQEAQ